MVNLFYINEFSQREVAAFLELPPAFEACRQVSTRVDKLSLVRPQSTDIFVIERP